MLLKGISVNWYCLNVLDIVLSLSIKDSNETVLVFAEESAPDDLVFEKRRFFTKSDYPFSKKEALFAKSLFLIFITQ